MKEVNKSIILASAILEIKRDKIKIQEIFNYERQISEKLRKIGYTYDRIDYIDIAYFCEAHDFNYTKDKVIEVNPKFKESLRNGIFENLPQPVRDALKFDKKYILPLIQDKKINLYYVNFMNKELADSLQSQGLLKFNKDGEYIINLNRINNKLESDKLKILRKLFVGSSLDVKESYRAENVVKIMNALEFIIEPKFKLFYESISSTNSSEDILETEYNEIFEIYSISKMNTAWMDRIGLNIPINNKEKGTQKKLTLFGN